MNQRTTGLAVSALACAAVLLCTGCEWKAESQSYEAACVAMQSDTNFPKNATIAAKDECKFHIAKSGGCVIVPYNYVDAAGMKQTDTYTVWVDRIAWDWKVDRLAKTPKY